MNAAFSIVNFFTEKKIIVKPLCSEVTNDEKQEASTWRKTQLKKFKNYTDDNLNPVKVNVIGPIKRQLSPSVFKRF